MNQDIPSSRAADDAPTAPANDGSYQTIVAVLPKNATADETFSAYQTVYAAHRKACADEMIVFKASLFEVLARSGIMQVEINFDGCGDSGQIEGIYAQNGAQEPVDLPTEAMTFMKRVFETAWPDPAPAAPDETRIAYQSTVKAVTQPITEAMEDIVYDLLREAHQGWEDNDGAFGLFRFDTMSRTITLEHNERYTDTNYSEHEW